MTRQGGPSLTIVVLTPQFPYPANQGTTLRNLNLILGLAQRHRVHLLSFGDPAESRETPLHDVCSSVQVLPPPTHSTRGRLRGLFLSSLPDMAQRLPSPEFASALAETLEREDPEVLEVEGIELAQYLFQAAASRGASKRPLLVFDDHNAEYVLQQRAFQTDARLLLSLGDGVARRWAGAPYSYVQWKRLRTYERRACKTADRIVAVSEPDAEALRLLVPGLEPVVVPNGVDTAYYSGIPSPSQSRGAPAAQTPSKHDLVFTGKMDFRPNVDAALWFGQEVLPLILRERPEVRFWIVGKDPHPRLAPLQKDPSVMVTGFVEDIRPFIASAALYVIPLRIGGGTRLKVLEAMAMGKAIVSTTLGCEGFDLVPGQELAIADEAAGFAQTVLDLLAQAAQREELGRTARRFATSRYDWEMIVPKLEAVYREP